MRFIHGFEEVGPDRMLHIRVSDDIPEGRVEVLLVVEPRPRPSQEERRAAAEAGAGILKHLPGSVDEFLEERRADEERREKALREAMGE